MKQRIFVLGMTLMLLLGLSIAHALAASSVMYLGKSTWTATITDSTKGGIGETFTITGGISKVGDEFYLFQGYVTPETDGPFVISGSGFMMGNNLVFTMSESQEHTDSTWRDSGVMHVTLDKGTLSGTFYDIGLDFNPDAGSRTFDQRYTAGTLACTGDPIPITASLAAMQLMILD